MYTRLWFLDCISRPEIECYPLWFWLRISVAVTDMIRIYLVIVCQINRQKLVAWDPRAMSMVRVVRPTEFEQCLKSGMLADCHTNLLLALVLWFRWSHLPSPLWYKVVLDYLDDLPLVGEWWIFYYFNQVFRDVLRHLSAHPCAVPFLLACMAFLVVPACRLGVSPHVAVETFLLFCVEFQDSRP